MSVTHIDARVRELSDQFDELVRGAKSIAIIAVDGDGEVSYLLPDDCKHVLQLIGGLAIVKDELIQRYSEGDH